MVNKSDHKFNLPKNLGNNIWSTDALERKERILAAKDVIKPDTIFRDAGIVNVFTGELEFGDIAVYKEYIVGIGKYTSTNEMEENPPRIINCNRKFVAPGFIDGHIHIESSMLSPKEFAKAVVPHGTTSVITDPHELVNVAGTKGLDFMLKESENLPLDVYVMLPSCVPATKLDESGANLMAEDLSAYINHNRVLGLAEVMNYYGTIEGENDIVEKIEMTKQTGKIVDGHAPGLKMKDLNAYITAGVSSDHECSTAREGIEKLRRGQWVMIREGTAAKNMEALKPLLIPPYSYRCMLVTDDKHPGDLLKEGHVDYLLKKAVTLGADPVMAIKMVTIQPAMYFGLENVGAIAPGYKANMVIIDDLIHFNISAVYKEGKLVAENGEMCKKESKITGQNDFSPSIYESFHVKKLEPEDFYFKEEGNFMRILELVPGELLTNEVILPVEEGIEGYCKSGINVAEDILKLAVIERHKNTGHIGLGLLKGYGLKSGAVASSISHDSHNLMVAGCSEEDMCLAANLVRENKGGLVLVSDGEVIGELPLPIGGLMCDNSPSYVDKILGDMKEEAKKLGIKEGVDPFMTLAFLSLSVIPKLRITTHGVVDVKKQEVVRTFFEKK